ncbi:MAG: aldehyde dehydrogenase family protein, partial [Pseudomonadota bacterium]
MSVLFETHRALLMSALEAKATRAFYSPFPEVPSGKIYGEHAKQEGERSFEALLGKLFPLYQPSDQGSVGAEESPFGFPLGITYPAATPQTLIDAAKLAGTRWANQTIEARVGVCLEALKRLNAESFLMAKAVENTTGQAFVMAFQAGGPHAQDRGLEAVAYAYDTMRTIPGAVRWEKPQGKRPPLVLDKTFHVVPRGVGLVIGCSTFPTWNSYPAIFANLATGNATIVKPHPGAILPLALTVKVIREVLAAEGQDPNTIILAADTAEAPVTMDYVESADIATIDFTGSSAFGATLRQSARGRPVFTEEAGVNPVIIAGTSDFA